MYLVVIQALNAVISAVWPILVDSIQYLTFSFCFSLIFQLGIKFQKENDEMIKGAFKSVIHNMSIDQDQM